MQWNISINQVQCSYPTDPTQAHYDLIGAIQAIKDKLLLELNFEHIKGHQDLGVRTVLPWVAWMNIEMDGLAKQTIDHQLARPSQLEYPENSGPFM